MRAWLDEDRVMEMDHPELLEAAAKELAKELTADTQEVPPPNRTGSVESDTDSAASRALELEIEEKRWLREERKAEREAQEKRAEREEKRAEREAQEKREKSRTRVRTPKGQARERGSVRDKEDGVRAGHISAGDEENRGRGYGSRSRRRRGSGKHRRVPSACGEGRRHSCYPNQTLRGHYEACTA